jgi:hypothetical protein
MMPSMTTFSSDTDFSVVLVGNIVVSNAVLKRVSGLLTLSVIQLCQRNYRQSDELQNNNLLVSPPGLRGPVATMFHNLI